MNMSSTVTGRVFKSESIEEYNNMNYINTMKARAAKGNSKNTAEPKQEVRHTVEITATHYLMEEVKKQTKYLELLSNKLAFIVDELTK